MQSSISLLRAGSRTSSLSGNFCKTTFLVVILVSIIDINSGFSQAKQTNLYITKEYSIRFPHAFTKSSQTIPSALGNLLMKMGTYEPKPAEKDSNFVYMIIETDYPDSNIHSSKKENLERFFRGSINGVLKNVKGKLLTESAGTIGIYPSRTVEVDYENGLAVIKMIMVLRENKMIIMQCITDTKNYPNSVSSNFFNSFKLL